MKNFKIVSSIVLVGAISLVTVGCSQHLNANNGTPHFNKIDPLPPLPQQSESSQKVVKLGYR